MDDAVSFLNQNVKIRDGLIMRKLDNTLLAYNENSGDMYEFNETSEFIVDKLKEEKSLKEIYELLCSGYEEERDVILHDYEVLIKQLIDLNVLLIS